MRQLHAGAQRDLHEMRDLRRDQRMFVTTIWGGSSYLA
jgi:hypothetical protein